MVGVLIVLFLYALFTLYWGVFTHITLSIAYSINNDKLTNQSIDSSVRTFNLYKGLSYFIYILVLIVIIVLSKYTDVKIAMYILNGLWLLGLGMIKVHISLIDHLINVLFIPKSLKTIEREFVIGCIEYDSGLKFKYRLKREMFNI